MPYISRVLFTLFLIVSPFTWANAKTIYYLDSEAAKDQYNVDLVKFLLSQIEHDYTLQPHPEKSMVGSRKASEVRGGGLSFAALSTNDDLEKTLRPIRFPILKGMLGHRVFLIRSGERSNYANIETLAELKQKTAGQGRFWGSVPAFQAAGLPMETPTKYKSLFYMLDGGRFDYFPRGINEIYSEIAAFPDLALEVEPKLMLVYPTAMYLFTSRENEEFALDLERAFNKTIEDGSFNQWFYSYPMIKDALSRIDLANRTVLKIPNPSLPKSAPLEREELWLDTKAIQQN